MYILTLLSYNIYYSHHHEIVVNSQHFFISKWPLDDEGRPKCLLLVELGTSFHCGCLVHLKGGVNHV